MTAAHTPRTLAEALRALADPSAVAVAGCTDLLVVDHATSRRHQTVVDVLRIPELSGIRDDGAWIDLGAATTFTQIRQSALVQKHAPLLCEVAATIGAWQIQNRATIGGNIANASPAGDSLPVLLALGAEVVVAGDKGERVIPYDAMHVAYRKTALAAGELITRVRVPKCADAVTHFSKVGTRAAQAISKVVVAMSAERDGKRLRNVRIACGSVAATPVRLPPAEAAASSADLGPALADAVGAAAAAAVQPIDDVRSTAEYRRFALARVVRRMMLSSVN